jgi:preprotein translocase subunit SecA
VYTDDDAQDEWDLAGLVSAMDAVYGTGVSLEEVRGLDRESLIQEFLDDALDAYKERDEELDKIQPGLMRDLERYIVLQVVDVRWREHLENMDYLREGIHLRGMAQKDPLVEYRNEGHTMFFDLNRGIREEVVSLIFHAEIEADPNAAAAELQQPSPNGAGNGALSYEHASLAGADAILAAGGSSATATAAVAGGGAVATGSPKPVVNSELDNIGRNDPCWCGSGKKYKKCHGA